MCVGKDEYMRGEERYLVMVVVKFIEKVMRHTYHVYDKY